MFSFSSPVSRERSRWAGVMSGWPPATARSLAALIASRLLLVSSASTVLRSFSGFATYCYLACLPWVACNNLSLPHSICSTTGRSPVFPPGTTGFQPSCRGRQRLPDDPGDPSHGCTRAESRAEPHPLSTPGCLP